MIIQKGFLTLGRTRGGGADGCHLKFFIFIFLLNDQASAPDVFSSSSFIPRANFKKSLVMVTFYGYDIRHRVRAGGQAIFQ